MLVRERFHKMIWLILFIIIMIVFAVNYPWAFVFIFTVSILTVIFTSHATRKEDDKIVSVDVMQRTQMTREQYQHSGFSVGLRGNPRFHWRVKNVPTHVEATVEVVYEDGKHRQLTLIEGSERYNRIFHQCEKRSASPVENLPSHDNKPDDNKKVEYIEIQTNQLVQGVYVIGEVIPEGNYDFRWVWGNGCVKKYADQTTSKGSNLFVWVGNKYDYESQIIVNVVCKSGECLRIEGNVIVEIRKSKPVQIDL